MHVVVYRSSVREGLYVYLPADSALDTLPEPVRRQLGRAEEALRFELNSDRKLGFEDPAVVIANLQSQGFHVQSPRDIEAILSGVAEEAANRNS